MKTANLTPLEDCWKMFADSVVPRDVPEKTRGLLRGMFYTGASSLYDLFMQNSDDEDVGCAMLEAVHAELEAHSVELAGLAGVSLAAIRQRISDDMARRRK